MLKRLTVENYRSLERVQVALHPLTAFVGANGTGKSSLLRAINLVLGQRYPSLSSLRFPQDFTLAEDHRELRIAVRLAAPWVHVDAMNEPHEIHGLQLSCRPYRRRTARADPGDPNFDYEPLANDGSPPQGVALAAPGATCLRAADQGAAGAERGHAGALHRPSPQPARPSAMGARVDPRASPRQLGRHGRPR